MADKSIGTMGDLEEASSRGDPVVNASSEPPPPTFLGIEVDRYNIARPWSPFVYFDSLRGVEDFQVYFWIAKDLGWLQQWKVWSLTFGTLTLLTMAAMILFAFSMKNIEEMYFIVVSALWLAANFTWMFGEVTHDDDIIYAPKAQNIFTTGMVMLAVYYLILKPFGYMKPSKLIAKEYEAIGLRPRLPFFENWRQYENFHILLWLGKDFAWCDSIKTLWLIFFFPTVFVGMDFIWCTFKTKDLMIDCSYYMSVMIWVIANAIWAFGELFFEEVDDTSHPIWEVNAHTVRTFRWWAAWVLIAAYIPLIVLHLIWIPLTWYGYLDGKNEEERGSLHRLSRNLSAEDPGIIDLSRASAYFNSVFSPMFEQTQPQDVGEKAKEDVEMTTMSAVEVTNHISSTGSFENQ
jgi:hypothetical protein